MVGDGSRKARQASFAEKVSIRKTCALRLTQLAFTLVSRLPFGGAERTGQVAIARPVG